MTSLTQAEYRDRALAWHDLPVWFQPWWLDATSAADAWDVTMARHGDSITAVLPYVRRRRFGFSILGQPPLTQSLGPWLVDQSGQRLSRQHDLLTSLAKALPKSHVYQQNWMPELTNWLPFHWAGYCQSTRYTYRIDLCTSKESLWQRLESPCRRAVRKAKNRFRLTVEPSRDVHALWPLIAEVYARQGMQVPYAKSLLERILRAGTDNGALTLHVASDAAGIAHAGAVIIHDRLRSYYIIGGVSEEHRNSGGMNLVLWKAITEAHARGQRIFDFEGSMIEPIESFFRSFGAHQTPYFRVWKYHHPVLRPLRRLRGQ